MYVVFVEVLCGVVVRLLVANGMSVAVGNGCYGASEDVGRVLYALNNNSIGVTDSDNSSAEDVGLVSNLLDTATECVADSDNGIAEHIYLYAVYASYAAIAVGVFNYLITKDIGITTSSQILCGYILACKCDYGQY